MVFSKIRPAVRLQVLGEGQQVLARMELRLPGDLDRARDGNGSAVSVTNDAGSPASFAAAASARSSSTRPASQTSV